MNGRISARTVYAAFLGLVRRAGQSGDRARLDSFFAPYRATQQGKTTMNPLPRLINWSADERDKLLPVPDLFDSDELVRSMGGGKMTKSIARSLYARRAKGEQVAYFRDKRDRLSETRRELRQQMQDERNSVLLPLFLLATSQGVLTET